MMHPCNISHNLHINNITEAKNKHIFNSSARTWCHSLYRQNCFSNCLKSSNFGVSRQKQVSLSCFGKKHFKDGGQTFVLIENWMLLRRKAQLALLPANSARFHSALLRHTNTKIVLFVRVPIKNSQGLQGGDQKSTLRYVMVKVRKRES